MARRFGKMIGLTVVLAAGAAPAMAAPFKCPHVGGDFTFGQEANVNSLDENTSGTISTHDVARIYSSNSSRATRRTGWCPISPTASSNRRTA